MTVTFRLSPQVIQAIAEAVSIFGQNEALLRVTPDSFSFLLSNKIYTGYFEISCDQHAISGLSDELSIGINVGNFKKILTLMRSGNSESDQLAVSIDHNIGRVILSYGNFTYRNSLTSIRDVPEPFDDHDYEWPATIELQSTRLDKVIKIADLISDCVTIGLDTETNTFYITARGDIDRVEYKCHNNSISILDSADVESHIDLSYLAPFQKFSPRNIRMTLEIGNDNPILIQYQLPNSNICVVYRLQHTLYTGR